MCCTFIYWACDPCLLTPTSWPLLPTPAYWTLYRIPAELYLVLYASFEQLCLLTVNVVFTYQDCLTQRTAAHLWCSVHLTRLPDTAYSCSLVVFSAPYETAGHSVQLLTCGVQCTSRDGRTQCTAAHLWRLVNLTRLPGTVYSCSLVEISEPHKTAGHSVQLLTCGD